MNVNKISDSELHLMSYQELRRLSILLQLPANIKKKYMISMIQAHQKGDACTKVAIANKIVEERKSKRLGNKRKQTKAFMLDPPTPTQQIPTDLSVSAKHEFETRFSYVAHYTSKDNMNAGISRIIKQKAEISRRNRSIVQQSRKPTRKLSTDVRTEIMLPRNHSLTTPIRLMPQYERDFTSGSQYESSPSGLSNSKNHFPDSNSYNYYFHGEYSNALMPPANELCRNEPYWSTREVYNNSLMPILSSLLTPNSITVNASEYASQYTAQNIMKGPPSFKGVYEKYIKNGSVIESQEFQASVTNSSNIIINNHYENDNNNNNYNINHGCRTYMVTKSDVDFEINSALEVDYQQYSRRNDAVLKNENYSQNCMADFYIPRGREPVISTHLPQYVTSVQDLSQCNSAYYRAEGNNSFHTSHHPFETPPSTLQERNQTVEKEHEERKTVSSMTTLNDYESVYIEDDKFWDETENGDKKLENQRRNEKSNFAGGLLTQSSLLSEVSENSTDFSIDTDISDPPTKSGNNCDLHCLPTAVLRCRYSLGHNKSPEAIRKANEITTLPSFLSTFCMNGLYNKAYSLCRNSFTATTETHSSPIMTCTYASQLNSHSTSQQSIINSSGNDPVVQRQWLYPSYPEPQAPFSMESTTYSTWNEYSNSMENKVAAHSNGQEVQVVKCRQHGCHYLYSMSNSNE